MVTISMYLARAFWNSAARRKAIFADRVRMRPSSKGDPNGVGLMSWPKIDQNQPKTMELGVRLAAMPLADREKLDFWTRYYNSPISRSTAF